MEVKPGHKMTEVGVIPEDWDTSRIGEVATFSGGSQPPRSTFRFTPAPGYIRLIQIRDYKTDAFTTFVPEVLVRKRCSAEDVMIGRYGPPIFQILRGLAGAYNVALIKVNPERNKVDKDFLYYTLKTDALYDLIDSLSRRTSGQTGVDMSALKAYGLPLPPLPEQRAIATALSDMDALLDGLDRQIAKKHAIKQATMQQLLTGQTRLPGFSGNWEVKRLEDLAKIQKGQLITTKTLIPGDIPVIAGGKQPAYFHASANRYGKTITVSASGASAGYVALHLCSIFASDCSTISESDSYSIEFIYYALLFRQDVIYAAQTGGAQPHVQPKDLAPLSISIPDDIAEQSAIAVVLTDMDAEITALETRRTKTYALKQAMMQELLTGRTRLI